MAQNRYFVNVPSLDFLVLLSLWVIETDRWAYIFVWLINLSFSLIIFFKSSIVFIASSSLHRDALCLPISLLICWRELFLITNRLCLRSYRKCLISFIITLIFHWLGKIVIQRKCTVLNNYILNVILTFFCLQKCFYVKNNFFKNFDKTTYL